MMLLSESIIAHVHWIRNNGSLGKQLFFPSGTTKHNSSSVSLCNGGPLVALSRSILAKRLQKKAKSKCNGLKEEQAKEMIYSIKGMLDLLESKQEQSWMSRVFWESLGDCIGIRDLLK